MSLLGKENLRQQQLRKLVHEIRWRNVLAKLVGGIQLSFGLHPWVCRAIKQQRLEEGLELVSSRKALKWLSFVEFDDINNKVLIFSVAQKSSSSPPLSLLLAIHPFRHATMLLRFRLSFSSSPYPDLLRAILSSLSIPPLLCAFSSPFILSLHCLPSSHVSARAAFAPLLLLTIRDQAHVAVRALFVHAVLRQQKSY